jgi:hypothetical protein
MECPIQAVITEELPERTGLNFREIKSDYRERIRMKK